jgi:hypothetical protein
MHSRQPKLAAECFHYFVENSMFDGKILAPCKQEIFAIFFALANSGRLVIRARQTALAAKAGRGA